MREIKHLGLGENNGHGHEAGRDLVASSMAHNHKKLTYTLCVGISDDHWILWGHLLVPFLRSVASAPTLHDSVPIHR